MLRYFLLLSTVVGLGACVSTQEMPMAPNMVRLDTHASGLLYAGSAAPQTLRRAAELTLQKGYTHFSLDQVGTAQGSEIVGVYSRATGSAYSASGYSTPIRAPTANVGATVIMFHANEPGAKGAFDAADVLKRGG